MSDFYERLRSERADLDEKIYKLIDFLTTSIFASLTQEKQDLLKSQLEIEFELSKILTKQIELIDKEN